MHSDKKYEHVQTDLFLLLLLCVHVNGEKSLECENFFEPQLLFFYIFNTQMITTINVHTHMYVKHNCALLCLAR